MGYDISIMRYSPDLRKRVLDFIQAGGSKTEAAFNVGRTTIYKWLNAPDPFAYQRPGPRIDYDALKQHIADFPDQTLKERAVHFGVSTFCIGYSLKRLGYAKKKTLGYKERCDEKRQAYSSTTRTSQSRW